MNTPLGKPQHIVKIWIKRNFRFLNDIVLEIFLCPAESAGVDSIFSEMKNTMSDNRRSLTDDHLIQTQLVKSWNKIIEELI